MDTRVVTPDALALRVGVPPHYGSTAPEVLETCALVFRAAEQWERQEVQKFQQVVGIYEQVWGRLLAIHRSDRWHQIDHGRLPGNYTALYALTTIPEEDWSTAVEGGLIGPDLSSRDALNLKSGSRLKRLGYPIHQTLEIGFSAEASRNQRIDTLVALRAVAKAHGAYLMTGVEQVTADVKFGATRSELIAEAKKILMLNLTRAVQDAGSLVKDQLGIQNEEELAEADLKEFNKFLNRCAGSVLASMQKYGFQYCMKLAYEYHRTDVRSRKHLYKKKLLELSQNTSIDVRNPEDSNVTPIADFAMFVIQKYLPTSRD